MSGQAPQADESQTPGRTRLYLAGDQATTVAALFGDSDVEVVPLDGQVPAASALKIAYASWTKGTAALLVAVRSYAAAEGVEDALLEEWARSQSELPSRTERTAANVAPKAWRWIAEMQEISRAYEAVGLPGGFHLAAADVYERLSGRKDAEGTTFAEVAADLLDSRDP